MKDETLASMGKLLDKHMPRDAVHIACVPMVANERLSPGQHVGVVSDGRAGPLVHNIGIVDPFLNQAAMAGDRFWLFLYPGSITSLKHLWTHPAFKDIDARPDGGEFAFIAENSKKGSEAWLREFCSEHGISYSDLLDAARDHLASGEYWTQYNSTSLQDAMYQEDIRQQFWKHYENVTGQKLSAQDRAGVVFSCSC